MEKTLKDFRDRRGLSAKEIEFLSKLSENDLGAFHHIHQAEGYGNAENWTLTEIIEKIKNDKEVLEEEMKAEALTFFQNLADVELQRESKAVPNKTLGQLRTLDGLNEREIRAIQILSTNELELFQD